MILFAFGVLFGGVGVLIAVHLADRWGQKEDYAQRWFEDSNRWMEAYFDLRREMDEPEGADGS